MCFAFAVTMALVEAYMVVEPFAGPRVCHEPLQDPSRDHNALAAPGLSLMIGTIFSEASKPQ